MNFTLWSVPAHVVKVFVSVLCILFKELLINSDLCLQKHAINFQKELSDILNKIY